ncbi:three-Cys-motif partner protein TcmP [Argonema galeatum]|uniref:three-Cys-motif partner protein TcmP n=1 Tax=Argonema galeatum TaxID=2942762 RepID=UPI002011B031|nr:three-Cys-motif partner protein TcmP [Argonema galeatum]MCL1465445.1 three-Cys-motif partner protein TcmP [Argonema galeatum A003/A1]
MSNSDTKWSADGKTIPDIEPHTKTKHLLTQQYVTNLIDTLYGKGFPRGIDTFTFVDGFCGGGIYNDQESENTWYGSPIRLINAVREGCLKSKRHYPLKVKFIFIDTNKQHLECLKNVAMSQAGLGQLSDEEPHTFKTEFSELIEQCEFINDEFENQVNYCIFQAEQRKGHSLFFLDPYGYLHVSMESFRKINSLNKSEIIYTLMARDIQRFVIDKDRKERESFYKKFEAEEYFKDLENLQNFGREAKFRDELMRLFREKGNAKKVFTFAMIPTEDRRVLYYLIHICSHLRALEVMKDSSWLYNNINYQYHYEIYGYGFRTASYYDQHQLNLQLDINQDSKTACIQRLSNDLDPIVLENNYEGITIIDLCNKTMELNPATREHYFEYLRLLRDEKQIKILRKNKKTNLYKETQSNDFDNCDIIKSTHMKQLSFFERFLY